MQSLVEQLSGDSNLISLRSRASLNRPFTRVREMEAKRASKVSGRNRKLESSLTDTARKISDLQSGKKDPQQRFILSPEQQKEVENYHQIEGGCQQKVERGAQELAQGHRSIGVLDQSRQHCRHAHAGGDDRRGSRSGET